MVGKVVEKVDNWKSQGKRMANIYLGKRVWTLPWVGELGERNIGCRIAPGKLDSCTPESLLPHGVLFRACSRPNLVNFERASPGPGHP